MSEKGRSASTIANRPLLMQPLRIPYVIVADHATGPGFVQKQREHALFNTVTGLNRKQTKRHKRAISTLNGVPVKHVQLLWNWHRNAISSSFSLRAPTGLKNTDRMGNQVGANQGPSSSSGIMPQLLPSPLSAPVEGTQCNPLQHPGLCYESIGGAVHAYRGPLAWGIGQCGCGSKERAAEEQEERAAKEEQERAAKEEQERAAKEQQELEEQERAKRAKDLLMLTLRRLVIYFCVA